MFLVFIQTSVELMKYAHSFFSECHKYENFHSFTAMLHWALMKTETGELLFSNLDLQHFNTTNCKSRSLIITKLFVKISNILDSESMDLRGLKSQSAVLCLSTGQCPPGGCLCPGPALFFGFKLNNSFGMKNKNDK